MDGYLALALFVTAAAGLATWWLRGALQRRRMRRRFRRGRVGEQKAVELLRSAGYRVLADQVSETTGLWIDDRWHEVQVRADLLVEKGGQTYVVEVKTGRTAPDPTSSATRRQLLDYSLVFDCDGLILADMQRGKLRHIRFRPGGRRRATTRHWPTLAAGILIGLLAGIAATILAMSTRS